MQPAAPSRADDPAARAAHLDRVRRKGVNPFVYWLTRALLQPFFHVFFRLSRIGREHVPQEGPVIFAANHRSFLDPFVIATLARRPIYFIAKKELFANRFVGWFLNSLGAFPIDRGAGDADAMAAAREILERGDGVLIFPEGTRIRPGSLASPKRGVGRLALETGAPVVPVACIGTENVRKGLRIRPHKVRIRAGAPLRFPKVEGPSSQLAGAVTERIWPCVMLQWEWLGGLPPVRRAAVVGAGAEGTALAAALAAAGIEVELGCRSLEEVQRVAAEGEHRGIALPAAVTAAPAGEIDLARHDLVVLDVPADGLPQAMAAHGSSITERTGVLVLSRGLVAPRGSLPSAYVAERCRARAVACLGGPAAGRVVASADAGFARQLADLLGRAGLPVEAGADVVGAELAAAAAAAAAFAAASARTLGAEMAGAAAGRVFAEVDALARKRGAGPAALPGLAGTGELVATLLRDGTRSAPGGLPLLVLAMQAEGVRGPVTEGLAEVAEGRLDAGEWAAATARPASRAQAA